MPQNSKISRRGTIQKPEPKKIILESDDSDINATNNQMSSSTKRKIPIQKTVRLDEDVMQSVKIVARFLEKTEQDFIIDAVKVQLNKHLPAAKAQITAEIAQLPSQLQ